MRVYHSKLKQKPFDEYRIVQHYSEGPLFPLPVLSTKTVIKVPVYRDSKPCNISHWCRDRSGVDSSLILIFNNTQAVSCQPSGADRSCFFSSVRPQGFYFQFVKPAIAQLRVAPALLDATRYNNSQKGRSRTKINLTTSRVSPVENADLIVAKQSLACLCANILAWSASHASPSNLCSKTRNG